MKALITSVAALALLWGCADTTAPTDTPVPAAARADIFGMAPEDAPRVSISDMTDDERDAYGAAQTQMRIDLEAAMAAPGGWREADERVRDLLDDYPLVEDYKVAQTAGTMILQTYLLDGPVDEDKAEAIAFYTDLLAQNGTPNAPLMERSLAALDGHWSEARIAEVAARVADAGERYVAVTADCDGCTSAEALRRVQSSGPADARATQVAAAAERLRALAG